jgi:hypothetical protein
MNDSPIFKARQAEIAKKGGNALPIAEIIAKKEAELKEVQEEAKNKSKKKTEPEVVAELEEPAAEVFPPVLENKAIQPAQVKEEFESEINVPLFERTQEGGASTIQDDISFKNSKEEINVQINRNRII